MSDRERELYYALYRAIKSDEYEEWGALDAIDEAGFAPPPPPAPPARHTWGGVTFEETGEVRPSLPGEWYTPNVSLSSDGYRTVHCRGESLGYPVRILKAVSMEGGAE